MKLDFDFILLPEENTSLNEEVPKDEPKTEEKVQKEEMVEKEPEEGMFSDVVFYFLCT